MKKLMYILITFTLLFSLTSCSNEEYDFTYDDLFEANSVDNVLSKYDSISYTLTNSLNGNLSYTLWVANDYFMEDRKDSVKITVKGNDYFYNKETKELVKMYNVSDKTYRDIHGNWTIIYRKKGNEKIIYKQLNKDTYSINVELTGESAYKEIEYLTSSKLRVNESIMYDIVVDKKTLLAKEFTEYIVDKTTGKKTKCAKVSNIKYNVKESKYFPMVEELEDSLKSDNENLFRKVTVVKNVNEPDEKVYEFKIKKGQANSMIIYDNETVDYNIYYLAYLDRECTKPYYYSQDVYNDMIIYLKKNN